MKAESEKQKRPKSDKKEDKIKGKKPDKETPGNTVKNVKKPNVKGEKSEKSAAVKEIKEKSKKHSDKKISGQGDASKQESSHKQQNASKSISTSIKLEKREKKTEPKSDKNEEKGKVGEKRDKNRDEKDLKKVEKGGSQHEKIEKRSDKKDKPKQKVEEKKGENVKTDEKKPAKASESKGRGANIQKKSPEHKDKAVPKPVTISKEHKVVRSPSAKGAGAHEKSGTHSKRSSHTGHHSKPHQRHHSENRKSTKASGSQKRKAIDLPPPPAPPPMMKLSSVTLDIEMKDESAAAAKKPKSHSRSHVSLTLGPETVTTSRTQGTPTADTPANGKRKTETKALKPPGKMPETKIEPADKMVEKNTKKMALRDANTQTRGQIQFERQARKGARSEDKPKTSPTKPSIPTKLAPSPHEKSGPKSEPKYRNDKKGNGPRRSKSRVEAPSSLVLAPLSGTDGKRKKIEDSAYDHDIAHGEVASIYDGTQWNKSQFADPTHPEKEVEKVTQEDTQEHQEVQFEKREMKPEKSQQQEVTAEVEKTQKTVGGLKADVGGPIVPGESGQAQVASERLYAIQPAFALPCRLILLVLALSIIIGCIVTMTVESQMTIFYGMIFCILDAGVSALVAAAFLYTTIIKWNHAILPADFKMEKGKISEMRKVKCGIKAKFYHAGLIADVVSAILLATAMVICIYSTAETEPRYPIAFAAMCLPAAALHAYFVHFWVNAR